MKTTRIARGKTKLRTVVRPSFGPVAAIQCREEWKCSTRELRDWELPDSELRDWAAPEPDDPEELRCEREAVTPEDDLGIKDGETRAWPLGELTFGAAGALGELTFGAAGALGELTFGAAGALGEVTFGVAGATGGGSFGIVGRGTEVVK